MVLEPSSAWASQMFGKERLKEGVWGRGFREPEALRSLALGDVWRKEAPRLPQPCWEGALVDSHARPSAAVATKLASTGRRWLGAQGPQPMDPPWVRSRWCLCSEKMVMAPKSRM